MLTERKKNMQILLWNSKHFHNNNLAETFGQDIYSGMLVLTTHIKKGDREARGGTGGGGWWVQGGQGGACRLVGPEGWWWVWSGGHAGRSRRSSRHRWWCRPTLPRAGEIGTGSWRTCQHQSFPQCQSVRRVKKDDKCRLNCRQSLKICTALQCSLWRIHTHSDEAKTNAYKMCPVYRESTENMNKKWIICVGSSTSG